jgi:hypothetical protein
MSGTGSLALRSGNLKYMPDLAEADGWYGSYNKKNDAPERPALFDLTKDPGERQNIFPEKAESAKRLAELLAHDHSSAVTRPR